MSGVSQHHTSEQFQRAKKKYHKLTTVNQVIDDDSLMTKDQKINALVLIAKELIEEQSKFQKEIALKVQKEKQLSEQLQYKNKVVDKYQSGLLKAKNDYYELQKLHKQLLSKYKEQEVKMKFQEESIENSKYTSQRKILSMQNQVNFLLKKDNEDDMIKKAEKLKKTLINSLDNEQNIPKGKKKQGKSQAKSFQRRRKSVK